MNTTKTRGFALFYLYFFKYLGWLSVISLRNDLNPTPAKQNIPMADSGARLFARKLL